MLRILYDERLKPWMSRAEALPIVRVIIGELLVGLNREETLPPKTAPIVRAEWNGTLSLLHTIR
ncbi:MAG: hypothetical protein HON18_14675 [Rhodospirillaceae bacterium]|nr:hypothetical protein [Rhodospirillaceae bacterium]